MISAIVKLGVCRASANLGVPTVEKPPVASVPADTSPCTVGAMYGRRPRCKGKESDFLRSVRVAAMYTACFRLEGSLGCDAAVVAAGPDVIR